MDCKLELYDWDAITSHDLMGRGTIVIGPEPTGDLMVKLTRANEIEAMLFNKERGESTEDSIEGKKGTRRKAVRHHKEVKDKGRDLLVKIRWTLTPKKRGTIPPLLV